MADPTFPLMMPISGAYQSEFTIGQTDAINRVISGNTFADQIAPPYWDAQITTAPALKGSSRLRDWTTFLDALRGAKKSALLFDPEQITPQSYTVATMLALARFGGGAFDGTAAIDVRNSQYSFDLGTLPVGFQILHGDYVGFVQDTHYHLARSIVDRTADGAGTIAALKVEPAVPTYFTASGTVNFLRPVGEFILQPDSISRPRGLEGGTISFKAKSRAV